MFDHRYNPKKPPLPLLPLRFKVYGFVLVAASSRRVSGVFVFKVLIFFQEPDRGGTKNKPLLHNRVRLIGEVEF